MALDRLSEILVQLPLLENVELNKIIWECTEIKRQRRLEEFRNMKDKESMLE